MPTPPLLLPEILQRIEKRSKRKRYEIEGLNGIARAAFVADLLKRDETPFLVISANEERARRFAKQLQFFMGNEEIGGNEEGMAEIDLLLPDELSPYESRKLVASRQGRMEMLAALFRMTQPFRPKVSITSGWGLIKKYMPKSRLKDFTQYVLTGADIDRDEFILGLVKAGYQSSPLVEDAGSFSKRGGIVDAFSPLYPWPLRLEFWGDTLESVRLFNPETQKSVGEIEEAYFTPATEIVIEEASLKRGGERLLAMAKEKGVYDRRMQAMLLDLEQEILSPEIEPYMPLFYEETAPLFAYLPENLRVFIDNPLQVFTEIATFTEKLQTQFDERAEDDDLNLEAAHYIVEPAEVERRLANTERFLTQAQSKEEANDEAGRMLFQWNDHAELKLELTSRQRGTSILQPLIARLNAWIEEGYLVFLVARNESYARRMMELLEPYQIKLTLWLERFPEVLQSIQGVARMAVHVVLGDIATGQIWPNERVVFLSEEEIFGDRKEHAKPKRKSALHFDKEAFLTNLDEIEQGDFLVHVEFGIGIYHGLVNLTAAGRTGDYLLIEYAGKDKLYLPVTRLDKVQKYTGAGGQLPRLDRLGQSKWTKTKARIKAAVKEMAGELLKLYAERETTKGHAFDPPDSLFLEFEAGFPYEETPDQERAIKDVLKDMQKRRPMDRLVCGDVGFGKTEVAMRAAMKAAVDGKQVAILVPTTVLAFQHGQSFKERFKDYPITVDTLSRFRNADAQRDIVARAKTGALDILIGTHRILSKDIAFKNLGLLIVDEEQRFGVRHKEKIKEMRKNVDVLTLTATPIPRTLNMAFHGLRDISVIQTPPLDRRSIRTYLSKFDEETIREAIYTELQRGGQVYFLHNRVETIEAMASTIRRLVPSARVAIGHGQMNEGELEKVMLGFVRKETSVLVCTTIIESGIDIPSVNTMIVNRADMFGLSQLYQLRGRVGRGKERAYAYLLVPSLSNLTKKAQKRLSALMRFTELGSGFKIASHDLEIRGAGNLLGSAQSGHINAIGIDLYLQLIEEAIEELKGHKQTAAIEPEINVFFPAFIPDDYIADTAQRLSFYKKLSQAKDEFELDGVIGELTDRFGRLPDAVLKLIDAISLKILVRRLNAEVFDLAQDRFSLLLGEASALPAKKAVELVSDPDSPYRLTPDNRFVVRFKRHEMEAPVHAAKNHLHELAKYVTKGNSG